MTVNATLPVTDSAPTGEYEEYLDDPGVADKRLLVVETEFASVLRVMLRDGNTLSAVLREAWDTIPSTTSNSPTPCRRKAGGRPAETWYAVP